MAKAASGKNAREFVKRAPVRTLPRAVRFAPQNSSFATIASLSQLIAVIVIC